MEILLVGISDRNYALLMKEKKNELNRACSELTLQSLLVTKLNKHDSKSHAVARTTKTESLILGLIKQKKG
jgi:hypothetical protein